MLIARYQYADDSPNKVTGLQWLMRETQCNKNIFAESGLR